MKKINNRVYLSLISGVAGWLAFILTDIIFVKKGISKRSYQTIAAGIIVSSRRKAERWPGQFLGVLIEVGLCMVGGIAMVKMLTTYGRDKLVLKGLFVGLTFGKAVTTILNKISNKKVIPNDTMSNILYIISHAAFALASVFTATKLGDDSLFDTPPQNDYSKPTEKTTEQIKESNGNNIQPAYPYVNNELEEITSVPR